jgi:hypothetical protein
MRIRSSVVALLVVAGLGATGFGVTGFGAVAHAAFITPGGWTRPTSDSQATTDQTTFQHWDVLGTSGSDPALLKAPDLAEINPNGAATVHDADSPASGAFITSGGNLYSFAGIIKPQAIVPGYASAGSKTEFLVQLRTQGQNIDTADLKLGGVLVSTLPNFSYTELSNVSLGGFGGFLIDHAWTFTAPADLASFTLDFGWGVTSSSFDQLSIDTHVAAVPEPAGLAMVTLGAIGIAVAARKARAGRATRRQA